MEKCKICGKEVKSLRALAQHLAQPCNKKSHFISGTKDYYDKFIKVENEGICKIEGCKNMTTYVNLKEGYLTYCSHKCYNLDPEIIEIRIESNKNRIVSKEARNKMSETKKKQWKDPKYIMNEPKVQKRKAEKMKEVWKDPNGPFNEEYKLKKSLIMKELWKNPDCFWRSDYFQKVIVPKAREANKQMMLNGGAAYLNSFIKNISKPQKKLFEMVSSLYQDARLNIPFLNYNLDIVVPSLRLIIEYDGAYWHQDFEYDEKRQRELEEWGWKFIRYRGTLNKDIIPTLDQLKNDIELICKEIKK